MLYNFYLLNNVKKYNVCKKYAFDMAYFFPTTYNIHETITTRVHKSVMDDGHGLCFTIVNNILLSSMYKYILIHIYYLLFINY